MNELNELVGLITQRDVFKHGVSSQAFMSERELTAIETGTLIFDIMTREVVTISPECTVRLAAEQIYRNKYGCLPVVDKQKKLMGIITDHDFVGTCIQLLEMLEAAEPLDDSDDL